MTKQTALLMAVVLGAALSGCENRNVEDRQPTADLMTTRTLGRAYLEENRLEEAETEFKKVIQMAPDEAVGYADLGLVYLRKGELTEAERQVTAALDIDPDNPDIRLLLAEIYQQSQREYEAVEFLEATLERFPGHVKILYKLAELYSRSSDPEARRRREEYLSRIVQEKPANIAARLKLAEILLRNRKAEAATLQMEEIRKLIAELPKEAAPFYEQALALMRAAKTEEARTPMMIVHNFLKVTAAYQSDLLELEGPGGVLTGFPIVRLDQNLARGSGEKRKAIEELRFTEVTSSVGLEGVRRSADTPAKLGAVLAVADYDSDGDQDLYVGGEVPQGEEGGHYLFRNDFGRFVEISAEAGLEHRGRDTAALFADYDNDGHLDLCVANTTANVLYRNNADEKRFIDVTESAGLAGAPGGQVVVFADLDHEGDLDLYLSSDTAAQVFRNNADGTFVERSARMGLAGERARSRDAAFADFDDDGDLDLLLVNPDVGPVLYTNRRQGRFEDITEASGFFRDEHAGAVAVGDYNNDGFVDVFVTALSGGQHRLYRNMGDGAFGQDPQAAGWISNLKDVAGYDACFFDFDNDGYLDLLVVGRVEDGDGRGIRLFRNDGTGRFEDHSSLLPDGLTSGVTAAIVDYNEDGDLDIFVAGFDGGVRLLRNDGGSANKYLKLQLVGLKTGSGKNNSYGIGAKVEVRAGELYQMRVVTEPVTHFGLGQRLRADVVRILWPNGVPQNLFYPGGEQEVVERQVLRSSCPFLYTWNGQEFTFVTDILLRSSLGLPVGMAADTIVYMFANSAKEYLKIPGKLLKEKGGKYLLRITEELWETSYLDQVALVVVDHPATTDVYVDEGFVNPPFPPLRIYSVADPRSPVSARDGQGQDLLDLLCLKDEVYVAGMTPTRYQGVTRMHDLILDLGDLWNAERVLLFLNGWVMPTEGSINLAISQTGDLRVVPPYLQVVDRHGRWQTVIENLGFPMGINKTVVADLTGRFLTDDYRVRIRTNMQIYWDHLFFSTDSPKAPIQKTFLRPISADLHYRGFSRMYRKGGLYSPHWFDYNDVSTEPRWRELEGYYTRYGDVLPLLQEADGHYVIINAGDEISLEFDATQVPKPRPGWSRDFVIFNDGWIKEGDLNTAFGQTVTPLPFREMARYPYRQEEVFPTDEEQDRILKTFHTRKVSSESFRRQVIDALPR